jgi:predicted metal-dependent phosphoesterase TrpH
VLIDIHTHTTRYSGGCSLLDPRVLVAQGIRNGLAGIAVTEHNRLWSKDELSQLRDETGSEGFVLLSGMEVDLYWHHFLIFNYPYPVNRTLSLKQLLRSIRGAGGVTILAHPFRYGGLRRLDRGTLKETFRLFDAVEILTPDHSLADNREGLTLTEAYGLTATGGSDSHVPSQIGTCATEFFIPVHSEEGLARAVREGLCSPRFGAEDAAAAAEECCAIKGQSR